MISRSEFQGNDKCGFWGIHAEYTENLTSYRK